MGTVENIRAMHIYDLRCYARKCGVRAPTTLRKNDIIIAIKEIEMGNRLPEFCKRGRKPTHFLPDYEEPEFEASEGDIKQDSYYDYYVKYMSENSVVDTIVNVWDEKDFMVLFDELIRNSFVAEVNRVDKGLYKLDFKYESIYIEVGEVA